MYCLQDTNVYLDDDAELSTKFAALEGMHFVKVGSRLHICPLGDRYLLHH